LEELKSKINHSIDFKSYVKVARNFKKKGVFFDKQNGGVVPVDVKEEHYDQLYDLKINDDQSLREIGKRYLEQGGRKNKKNTTFPASNDNNKSKLLDD
jgi:hypothetical protein